MATPTEVTMENITGTWALQGINWIIRKTISMTEVTVKMKHFLGKSPQTGEPVSQIAIDQSTSMSSTSENRFLDWSENPQEDPIFGRNVVQSRLIGINPSSGDGARPFVEVQASTDDPNIGKFLRGEIDENLQPCYGFLVEPPKEHHSQLKGGNGGVWLNVVIRNQESKSIAEQVWGFEMVGNERRYVRRVVVSDTKGSWEKGRLVYNFVN
ncbi:hypothetical protein B0J13DRAFT_524961 [Dactylonectria estremocensis]|uniref:Uncharacterized protein n=1 Tax=Dactylonectria estremocensis TaxID=1079267 RepID=A0A9P9EVL9_9HYPO|nr:hypothetical protein B0J13DRAFT_524961 [Dactylonectria estremocensis]